MRIAGIIKNDVVNGIDVCVSLFTQGCPHRCKGCFNPETWDYDGGYEINDLKGTIVKAISENFVHRNFSILGGEPLCPHNREMVKDVVCAVRTAYSSIKIFIWTGYTMDMLESMAITDPNLDFILRNVDYVIDGPFEEDKKEYDLWLRGSSNQKVYKSINGIFEQIEKESL